MAFVKKKKTKKKKHVLHKGMIESKAHLSIDKFSLVTMKVFSYDFAVPGIVHFLLFEVRTLSTLP